MAQAGFLFVNKDSRSPSLSRNTGSEASLASKVNRHVQQQRFWKASGPRKNWYRPFIKPDSSAPSSPSTSDTCLYEDAIERRSPSVTFTERPSLDSPKRAASPQRTSPTVKRPPRSVPMDAIKEHPRPEASEEDALCHNDFSLIVKPGSTADPFNNTAVPITPDLRAVLTKHLRWAVSSSISEFSIHEGVRRILQAVMTDRMHAAAFLAMATAQQRKAGKLALPHDQSPEYYSYQATKMIREHIVSHPSSVDDYTYVDVFRLAMCEWLNGNIGAARIHFAYIAQNWHKLKPKDWGEQHNHEVISSEDVFFSIDIDEKPLLQLNWEPILPAGPVRPEPPLHDVAPVFESNEYSASNALLGSQLLDLASTSQSSITPALESFLSGLRCIPHAGKINFASATSGMIWIMKRRIHATLHRLQSLDKPTCPVDDAIRRTLIILLVLASTTQGRRVARTDVPRLAVRLRKAMLAVEYERRPDNKALHNPALWLWMSITGLIAAQEDNGKMPDLELLQWFRKRSTMLTRQVCGPFVTMEKLKIVLLPFLYFEHVQESIVCTIVTSNRSEPHYANGKGMIKVEDESNEYLKS